MQEAVPCRSNWCETRFCKSSTKISMDIPNPTLPAETNSFLVWYEGLVFLTRKSLNSEVLGCKFLLNFSICQLLGPDPGGVWESTHNSECKRRNTLPGFCFKTFSNTFWCQMFYSRLPNIANHKICHLCLCGELWNRYDPFKKKIGGNSSPKGGDAAHRIP